MKNKIRRILVIIVAMIMMAGSIISTELSVFADVVMPVGNDDFYRENKEQCEIRRVKYITNGPDSQVEAYEDPYSANVVNKFDNGEILYIIAIYTDLNGVQWGYTEVEDDEYYLCGCWVPMSYLTINNDFYQKHENQCKPVQDKYVVNGPDGQVEAFKNPESDKDSQMFKNGEILYIISSYRDNNGIEWGYTGDYYDDDNDYSYDGGDYWIPMNYLKFYAVERFVANGSDGQVEAYEGPEYSDVAEIFDNGTILYIISSYIDNDGIEWAHTDPEVHYDHGYNSYSYWVPMNCLTSISAKQYVVDSPDGLAEGYYGNPESGNIVETYENGTVLVVLANYVDSRGIQWGLIKDSEYSVPMSCLTLNDEEEIEENNKLEDEKPTSNQDPKISIQENKNREIKNLVYIGIGIVVLIIETAVILFLIHRMIKQRKGQK